MRQTFLFRTRWIFPALAFFLAALALIGWALNIDFLKHIMAPSVAMNPATSVCMILLALEAIRQNIENGNAVLYKAGQLAIVIVIAASAMKLCDLVLGSSFAIDQLLFRAKLDAEPNYPSRMAPNTAACFFILGWAMQFMRGKPDSSVFKAQILAIAALVLSLLALTGNMFHVHELSGLSNNIPMAANTALSFILISGSLLLASSHKSFLRVFAGKDSSSSLTITAILVPTSIVIPFILGWLTHLGATMDLFDAAFALALSVILNIVALLFISYLTARKLFLLDAESTQMHAALRQSHEAYHGILSTTLDGFWIVGPEGRLLDANNRYAEQSGYSRDELLNMRIPDLEAAESAADTAAHIQRIIANGGDQFETRHRRKDGSVWHVEISTTFLASEGGRFFVFVRDITERKKAEAELKQTKARYDYATAIGKVGTWDWELISGNLVWSDETFRLLGLTPGAVTPSFELFLERVHPEDRDFLNNAVQEALHEKQPYTLDCRLIIGSGKKVTCHIEGKVEFDADGNPVRMLGTIQDISERKQIENALLESEARQSAILNNSPYLTWLKDPESRYLKVNKAYADYARLKDPQQAVGKTDFDFWPRELAEKYRADDAEVIASRQQKHVEEPSFDGEKIHWVETYKTPIIDNDGKVLGTTGFAHDITERKLAEDQIRNLAFYDTLTQLPNRRLLDDRIKQAMVASKRSGLFGALLFLDLDNFKPLNDAYGHGVGDLLLVEVAHRLSSCVRQMDTVARFGGDEFVVMLTELDADKAESAVQSSLIAEKICASLGKPYLLTFRNDGEGEKTIEHRCSASIGAVLFNSEANAEEVLKLADMAMYKAKEAGRNQVHFHGASV